MSHLSGHLETFDLRQVLVLLASSSKTGQLRVAAERLEGRIVFEDGVLTSATASGPDAPVLESHSATFDEQRSGAEWPLEDEAEEHLTEVFVRLTELESGTFDFDEGTADAPAEPDAQCRISVEELLKRVDERIEQWMRIGEVIPSTHTAFRLAPRLPDDTFDVTLDGRAWTCLAAAAGGSSVATAATTLNVSEFTAAKKFADLVRQGLLAAASGDERPTESQSPAGSEVPRVKPTVDYVAFSHEDLTREEIDEIIRGLGQGIYPSR